MEFGAGPFNWEENNYPATLIGPKAKKRCGLPQWGIKEWRGKIYSANCRPQDFLREYAKNLDTVELSSTFYSKLSDSTVLDWKKSVSSNFTFLPKWPKEITHVKGLYGCLGEAKDFIRQMELLEENLGTTLLQLPPNFSREQTRALYLFLKEIPKNFPIAIEFRHSTWFENQKIYPKLEEYMMTEGISSVVSDTPTRRDVFHLSFTGRHNIIRYLSDETLSHDEKRLKFWRDSSLLKESSFVLHCPQNEVSPDLINYIFPDIAQKIKDDIGPPQQSLF